MPRPARFIAENSIFTRLTTLKDSFSHDKEKVLCQCICGVIKEIKVHSLTTKQTKSCGCLNAELIKIRLDALHKRLTKHGHRPKGKASPEYYSWRSMRERVLNKKSKDYSTYGGRGITICKRWDNFSYFLIDMGIRPLGTSLYRIDNFGNYEPENCRWATPKIQSNNRRKRTTHLPYTT